MNRSGHQITGLRHFIRPLLATAANALFAAMLLVAPALSDEIVYSVQIGAYRHFANAEKDIARLRDAGRDVFSRQEDIPGKGKLYRVYVGMHDEVEGARLEARILRALDLVDSYWIHAVARYAEAGIPGLEGSANDRTLPESGANKNPTGDGEKKPGSEDSEKEKKARSAAARSREEKPADPKVDLGELFDMRGQLSGWTIENRDQGGWSNSTGLRYIPQIRYRKAFKSNRFFEASVAANGYAAYETLDQDRDPELELYRLAVRYATPQSEIRIGLQKINFGPAYLLRPLRWFDQLDPRDPLQLTDGVYALRYTYYTPDNASLWAWVLYDNDRLKGNEIFRTTSSEPEIGLRIQYPVWGGEIGATFHTRKAEAPELNAGGFTENRYALDGRWEPGIGIWFETVHQEQMVADYPYKWQQMVTVGLDYTFGIGSGLYFLLEHMAVALSDSPYQWDNDAHLTAFSLSYPLGLFDSLGAVGYYSWGTKDYYQHLSWQRTYDHIVFQLSGFHYPQSQSNGIESAQSAIGAGYGAQLMVVYNH